MPRKSTKVTIEDILLPTVYTTAMEAVEAYIVSHKVDFDEWQDIIDSEYEKVEYNELDEKVTIRVHELISGAEGQYIDDEFVSWFDYVIKGSTDIHEAADYFKERMSAWLNHHRPSGFTGNFYITNAESDGSLCVFYDMPRKVMTFSQWRHDNGYKDRDTLVNDMSVDDKSEGDIDDAWDNTLQEFYLYCEDYNYKPEMDE